MFTTIYGRDGSETPIDITTFQLPRRKQERISMTITELTERFGLNRDTIYRWIRSGKVSPRKNKQGHWTFGKRELNRVEKLRNNTGLASF